ncbi:PAS domain-containing protein [Desertihabitans brevis]|uniref:histidine kinase n=1 Tax=Desertihabitans brevis TaxID=2268447 RepID=A0A367YU93_9ACTN|nr:ATP-binding protein [Desertihabitans brevis]RCK69463.1 PAS domain-containing protein [Desertihabitans brevis]
MRVEPAGVLVSRWYLPVGGAVVVAAAAVLLSPLPQPVRATVSDWGVLGLMLSVAAALWVRGRTKTDPGRRRAWQLFAVGCLLAAVGNMVLLLPPSDQSASALVVATVAAIVVGSTGTLRYPSIPLGRVELARVLADGLVVGLSLLGILLGVVSAVRPDLGGDDTGWTVLVLPVADCVVVTVLVIMVLRSPPADYARFYTAALGFICIGVADTGFALRQLAASPATTGEPTDLGWFVGYLGIIVAVLSPDRPARPGAHGVADRPMLGTATVYACLVAAAVVLMVGPLGDISTPVRVLAVLVAVAVALRELLVTYDNLRLRRGLTRLVEQRTEQLRESAELSEAVAASVGDGVLAADLDGRLTYANAAAATLLDWPRTRLVGRPLAEVVVLDPDGGVPPSRPLGWVGEAVENGRVSTGRTHCRQPDGTLVPVQLTVSPLSRSGRTTGCVVALRDLRGQERVERMKSEFVSTVSHELRTPLTSIRGVLGLMADGRLGPVAPQAVPMVRIASESTERLSRLVDDLLDVERLQSGRFPLFPTDVDLAELARRAVDQSRLLFTAREVEVGVHAAGEDHVAWGDPDRIQQVLTNLLSNAAKYAPPGSEVDVVLGRDPAGLGGRGAVAVAVRDRGPGIPADKLEQIFDRFVQADQSDTRAKEGTGLGLAIARQLVHAMHGSLRVESEPGRSTTFTMELPLGDR